MKIHGRAPIRDTRSVGRVGRASASKSVGQTGSVSSVDDAQPSLQFLGIPADEMTPKVRSAIVMLLKEVDELRFEVEAASQRLVELEQLADLDPLAPVGNRRAFVRDLSRMISYCQRYDVPASLIYFDANDLKVINDTCGHAGGDAALIHIATILMDNTRASDVVGRLGGDEFAVLLPQTTEEAALEKARELSALISEDAVHHEGHDLHVHVAFGAYTFKPGEKPAEVLDQADRRMYEHKREQKARAED